MKVCAMRKKKSIIIRNHNQFFGTRQQQLRLNVCCNRMSLKVLNYYMEVTFEKNLPNIIQLKGKGILLKWCDFVAMDWEQIRKQSLTQLFQLVLKERIKRLAIVLNDQMEKNVLQKDLKAAELLFESIMDYNESIIIRIINPNIQILRPYLIVMKKANQQGSLVTSTVFQTQDYQILSDLCLQQEGEEITPKDEKIDYIEQEQEERKAKKEEIIILDGDDPIDEVIEDFLIYKLMEPQLF